jgi:hypothetical protein
MASSRFEEAGFGMLIVETISKIGRAYFVQKKPIKVICRVSRKVVRKVIRSEATEFRYERATQPLPKLGPWVATLDELLMGNEAKPARGQQVRWLTRDDRIGFQNLPGTL